jgi:excisionase family DNA binding protein
MNYAAPSWRNQQQPTVVETPRATILLTLDDLRAEGATVSIERAGEYLGISRALAYAMARDGLLATIKCGQRRFRVPTSALLKMLDV